MICAGWANSSIIKLVSLITILDVFINEENILANPASLYFSIIAYLSSNLSKEMNILSVRIDAY